MSIEAIKTAFSSLSPGTLMVLGGLITLSFTATILFILQLRSFLRRQRTRSCRQILISGKNGSMTINLKIVRDFLSRELQHFKELAVVDVSLFRYSKSQRYGVTVVVKPAPGSNLKSLRTELERTVLDSIHERLGLPELDTVELEFKSFSSELQDEQNTFTSTPAPPKSIKTTPSPDKLPEALDAIELEEEFNQD